MAKEPTPINLGSVVDAVPEICNFVPKEQALRLKVDNTVWIENEPYELRIFAFLTNPLSHETFGDWVRKNGKENVILKGYDTLKIISVLAFSINTEDTYVNLSLRKMLTA